MDEKKRRIKCTVNRISKINRSMVQDKTKRATAQSKKPPPHPSSVGREHAGTAGTGRTTRVV